MTRKVSYSFKTCDTCSKWVLKNKNCHETSSKAAIWTNRRTYTFEMDNEAPGRKSLAPMSFLFPITFFSQARVQDSATGNIVTQYHLPHGRVVGVYTSSPTSSMLLRRVACHPAGRKTNLSKGRWALESQQPACIRHCGALRAQLDRFNLVTIQYILPYLQPSRLSCSQITTY